MDQCEIERMGGTKMSQQETKVFILFFFLFEEQAKAYREEDKNINHKLNYFL